MLSAYDVTEVSEEKSHATTDGSESVKSPWAFAGAVGQIFIAWSWVHFLWGKQYNFGVKKLRKQ